MGLPSFSNVLVETFQLPGGSINTHLHWGSVTLWTWKHILASAGGFESHQ